MALSFTTTTSRRRAAARSARGRRPRAASLTSLARTKRSGGPEDRALYRCECGHAFQAAVSTTVACPGCGQTQAW
jgi:hypothetical protein